MAPNLLFEKGESGKWIAELQLSVGEGRIEIEEVETGKRNIGNSFIGYIVSNNERKVISGLEFMKCFDLYECKNKCFAYWDMFYNQHLLFPKQKEPYQSKRFNQNGK